MLQQLGAHIVIEGVETEEQKEFLLGCNCTDVQGFLFYRPMPVEEFDKLLWQQEREPDMANGLFNSNLTESGLSLAILPKMRK